MLLLGQNNLIVDLVGFRPRKRVYQLSFFLGAATLPLSVNLDVVVEATVGSWFHF